MKIMVAENHVYTHSSKIQDLKKTLKNIHSKMSISNIRMHSNRFIKIQVTSIRMKIKITMKKVHSQTYWSFSADIRILKHFHPRHFTKTRITRAHPFSRRECIRVHQDARAVTRHSQVMHRLSNRRRSVPKTTGRTLCRSFLVARRPRLVVEFLLVPVKRPCTARR